MNSAFPYYLTPRWSQSLQADPVGLCLARETGALLAWDQSQWLHLLDASGHSQGRHRPESPIAHCGLADDGSLLAVAGKDGALTVLGPDLKRRWRVSLPHPLVALALEPFAALLAVSDIRGGVHFFDAAGHNKGHVQAPRALHHLAFVPTRQLLAGSADFGLAGVFDQAGHWTWREGLVVHVGALSVNHDGSSILLACFSEGVQRRSADGKLQERIGVPEPCRFVAQSFDGFKILAGGLSHELYLLDRRGQLLARHKLEQPFASLAFGPLGEVVYAACPGHGIVQLKVKRKGTELR